MDNPPTMHQLKAEAHRLIEAIARRPGSIKLLLGVLPVLQMYANYKANQQQGRILR
ncbi:hypothetical protein H6F86_21520 [Phormidium sp. FACHB-592]|uniref:Uncharacterized protein n=1 Tax=Stenomitos frigidus AS-A4 TaxID=2933935 RepID=A0ABV0KEZ4_9CYAN|nr:hypothetical protein [Phormidium sp. FACHB-592]MBD2076415.1 hypothetical protein [Phormidium sp. FACHB-592]